MDRDVDEEADALLARIQMIRDDLDAGRLNAHQIRLYRQLGEDVERVTRFLDLVDADGAQAAWRRGADLIRSFLDDHFPRPTRH